MALTDTAIRNARAQDKAVKLTDSAGMYLLVQPTGARLWRLDYRFQGKRKTLALGAYPSVTLADARERRETARRALAAGQDPGALRKLEKRTARFAAANTFEAIGREWMAKREREGKAPVTLAKARWLLDFACPMIGGRPIAEIGAPDLLEVLRIQERRGCLETARRLRSTCGQIFRYAIVTGRAVRDPSADLRGALIAPRVKHRSAVTEPKAIGELLRAIDAFSGQPTTLAALRLMPLTLLRPGELRHGTWSEVDLEAAIWRIPAEQMKMRAAHLVPLSRQAVAALRDLRAITGGRSLIFPGLGRASRPMSENTINAALRRLGYAKDEMTGHGFRAMAATRLNEMGRWNPDAIERQLAHAESNKVRKVSKPLFEALLAAFARQTGAGRRRSIVLVLDNAGWHGPEGLAVPEGISLVFLPPYSPELQPAVRLWPLVDGPVVNRHFASLAELDATIAERCRRLDAATIRPHTDFHWWPKPKMPN